MGASIGPVPVFYHPDYEKITQTPGHPESPDRVREILNSISSEKLDVQMVEPEPLKAEDLHLVHGEHHIGRVRDFGIGYMDPDTFHSNETYGQSLRAAGGVVEAARRSCDDGRATFALARPPGHHAGSDFNMGFCYFNNVALAARVLQRSVEGIEKVAIVDIDVHHGNGTYDIFCEDPSVLFISSHQWGIFPGTGNESEVGIGDGKGTTINIPLSWGAGDQTYREAFERIVLPALRSYSPDMLFVSLGVDAHVMDPLAGLSLSTPGYLKLTGMLHDHAVKEMGGRICFELEGGYHVYALAEVVAGTVSLASKEPKDTRIRYGETREKEADTQRIKAIEEVQSSYWSL
jgi:acetoin utilization deacetylase AcuC-like enzyme